MHANYVNKRQFYLDVVDGVAKMQISKAQAKSNT